MQRRGIVVLLVVAGVLSLSAGLAMAQCAFNAPTKAKGFKTSMVRAFAGCPGITFASPNTSTMAGVPGCTAPFALSEYEFNDVKSGCSVKLSQSYESPCPNGIDAECADIRLKAKCSGVLDPDGMTPTSEPGWALNTVTRATFDDQVRGDMTVLDFPAQFAFAQGADGKFKLDLSYLDLCLFFPCSGLPACTQMHLLSVAIADPDGNIFAVAGSSSR